MTPTSGAGFRHVRCVVCGRLNPEHRVRTCSDVCHTEWSACEARREAWRKMVHAEIGALIARQHAADVARASRR